MQIPAASTPAFDVSGLNYCGDYSSCTQERAKQGSLLRLSISGVTSQRPTSESNPTIKEAVCADKVIWLAGALSSAPTVGRSRLLGILAAPPVTVTIASPCPGVEGSQRSNFSSLVIKGSPSWKRLQSSRQTKAEPFIAVCRLL